MTRRNFKNLIILQWILGVISCVVYFATVRHLPQPLQNYLDELKHIEPTTNEWILIATGLFLSVAYLVIYIGLYFFKNWAKRFLLPVHVLLLLMLPFSGAFIETGLVGAINYLYSLVNGGILFLVYFSPVNQMFEADDNL